MKTVVISIDRQRCKGCELCIAFCPGGVLTLARDEFNSKGYRPAVVGRPEACTGCAHCARMCPEAAIAIAVELPVRAGSVPVREGGGALRGEG